MLVKAKVKVVCYNCGKITDKDKAFYITEWDCYYCKQCYLKLLNGEPVKRTNWRKRGV